MIGRVIESYARRFGYGVVREFTGHGIGTSFHSGLVVPHFDDPDSDTVIEAGMTFTIEPMLNLGTHEWEMWDDGWTVVTRDRQEVGPVRAHPAGHRRRAGDPDLGRLISPPVDGSGWRSGPVGSPRTDEVRRSHWA